MSERGKKKNSKGNQGVKAFIAAASVTATIAGWAILPANHPLPASAALAQPQQSSLYSNSPSVSEVETAPTQAHNLELPTIQLPAVEAAPTAQPSPPSTNTSPGRSPRRGPTTSTHSSR